MKAAEEVITNKAEEVIKVVEAVTRAKEKALKRE
jgi:hypothetical protein